MAQDPNKEPKPPLPADHGQFGRSDATEDYKPLAPPPEKDGADAGKAVGTRTSNQPEPPDA